MHSAAKIVRVEIKHTRRSRGRLMVRKSREALRKALIFLARKPWALLRPEPSKSSQRAPNRWAAANQSAKDTIHSQYLSPQSRQRSSGATFVPMMEPTHLGDRDDPPGFWRLDGA